MPLFSVRVPVPVITPLLEQSINSLQQCKDHILIFPELHKEFEGVP